MLHLAPLELLIILALLLLVFGAGRVGRLAGELGEGIRSMRVALREDPDTAESR